LWDAMKYEVAALVKHDGRDFYRVVAQEFFGG
jgi:hypothetical protein